jgi:hypothetical protein
VVDREPREDVLHRPVNLCESAGAGHELGERRERAVRARVVVVEKRLEGVGFILDPGNQAFRDAGSVPLAPERLADADQGLDPFAKEWNETGLRKDLDAWSARALGATLSRVMVSPGRSDHGKPDRETGGL